MGTGGIVGGQRKKVVGGMTGMGTGHFGSEVET